MQGNFKAKSGKPNVCGIIDVWEDLGWHPVDFSHSVLTLCGILHSSATTSKWIVMEESLLPEASDSFCGQLCLSERKIMGKLN